MEQRLLVLVLLALALGLLTVGFGWLFARLWCRPRRVVPHQTPAEHGLAYEPVEFTSSGARLSGWFIPESRERVPTIIIAHGWSRNAAQMLPLARALHHSGHAVLLYDARGHGTSEGKGFITIRSLAEDLVAAVDYLEDRPDVDPARIGVVGHSMGGASAIVAAAADPRIRALASSSAFADITALSRRTLRQFHVPLWPFLPLVHRFIERAMGTSIVAVSPVDRIADVDVPILLIHGDADRFVPPSDLDALYRGANGNATRLLLPRRRHSDVVADPRFTTEVIGFLSRVMGAPDVVERRCIDGVAIG